MYFFAKDFDNKSKDVSQRKQVLLFVKVSFNIAYTAVNLWFLGVELY